MQRDIDSFTEKLNFYVMKNLKHKKNVIFFEINENISSYLIDTFKFNFYKYKENDVFLSDLGISTKRFTNNTDFYSILGARFKLRRNILKYYPDSSLKQSIINGPNLFCIKLYVDESVLRIDV